MSPKYFLDRIANLMSWLSVLCSTDSLYHKRLDKEDRSEARLLIEFRKSHTQAHKYYKFMLPSQLSVLTHTFSPKGKHVAL